MTTSHDVIVIGGGLAGLYCALRLHPLRVLVVAATPLGSGASSVWAQGGIAAALGEGDTPEQHAQDTIRAGAGLVDEHIAHLIAEAAPEQIRDLLSYGVPFDRDAAGSLMLSKEAAHSARRIVRVQGDTAGKAIMAALVHAARASSHISFAEGCSLQRLIYHDGRVTGVVIHGKQNRSIAAPATVLATGGLGHLYAITTNPPQSCGQGIAIAALAGAELADMEFVQFHPTALNIGKDPAPLASEALRGDGAILTDKAGHRFMKDHHPDAELAPRDVVARGVFAAIQSGNGAFLDARPIADLKTRFPTFTEACLSVGLDPQITPVPVAPAAHYHMGGIATDDKGRTSLSGLWAAGEVACTGAHGANRLASNSLLEAIVFAHRAADDILSSPLPAVSIVPGTEKPDVVVQDSHITQMRMMMTDHVGVIRERQGLEQALEHFRHMVQVSDSSEVRHRAITSTLIAAAALRRTESRGGHYRSDYPTADPAQQTRQKISLSLIDMKAPDEHA